MSGVEIVVGYLFAWAVRKTRRLAGRADAEVDRALDTGMDRLHDLVSSKFGQDPVMERVREEAEAGYEEPSDRTRRRLALALEDAIETDEEFAKTLQGALEQLAQTAPKQSEGILNEISGGTVHGQVIQARDITGGISITTSPSATSSDQA
jgi:hypothetical protein